MKSSKILTCFGLIVAVTVAAYVFPTQAQTVEADTAAVAQTVRSFHEALAAGDSKTVSRLLAPDAVVLENGNSETRKDYLSHHLSGDIEFAQAVSTRRGAIQVKVSGDVAWASSTSETQGNFRKRAINSTGAELMVLSRTAEGWVIRATHWSSGARH